MQYDCPVCDWHCKSTKKYRNSFINQLKHSIMLND
nr:MAG TPA: zinc-ribbon domain protein [Caudoviricetes sp.]